MVGRKRLLKNKRERETERGGHAVYYNHHHQERRLEQFALLLQ